MKSKILNVFFGLVFVVGLAIMLYPTVSNLINRHNQSQVVNTYIEEVNNMDDETYVFERDKAMRYNELISHHSHIGESVDDASLKYDELLDLGGMGIMGILKIPVIDVELPIYHGTDAAELQVGVGHYEGSSLPVGGKSTHSVLTGHTGLPSSRLLTDIDQLEKGDIFYVTVLKETLAYEVDQIKIVLPEELSDIDIVEGEDYCTLVTCTPYGINTHRLLVRGKRIAYVEMSNEVSQELQIIPFVIVLMIAVGIYMLLFLLKNKLRKKG